VTEITMPRLSDSMEEGTVAKWLVEAGAHVEKGQPLVEIDTDKATVVYEAEESGTLAILAAEGETVALGAPIARIGDPGQEARELKGPPPDKDAGAPPAPAAPTARTARAAKPGGNVSPVARRLAAELGVDLAALSGTGPGGIVTKADVEQAAADGGGASDETARVEPLTQLQRTVARRMSEGAAVPTFAIDMEIDMTAALELRSTLDPKPSLNDLVVKACALVLREFPRMNGSYTDAGFELHEDVNVGIAVATEDGLVVPTIPDADTKPLAEIAALARELAAKVRDRKISLPELEGGTFTVTNLGMFGVRRFLPILNPPQAGILAAGDASKRPFVDEGGSVVARTMMNVTLVCDHRIVYGADAAKFLGRVRELLESPEHLAR
jgi:pyruvate dehydrogenase E2 component (dihydrolipoamide acetyltransferase)